MNNFILSDDLVNKFCTLYNCTDTVLLALIYMHIYTHT